jgi:hypothetical protein
MARTRQQVGAADEAIAAAQAAAQATLEQAERVLEETRQRQADIERLTAELQAGRSDGNRVLNDVEAPTAQELTLAEWQDRLEELDPEGGVYVTVLHAPPQQGRNNRVWVGNLTDPKGDIEPTIERMAQAKAIHGPECRFLLQPRSRHGRYLPGRNGASASYELWLAVAPGPPLPAPPTPSSVDPIAAAEKMLEAGKRLTPAGATSTSEDAAKMVGAILDAGQKFAAASSGATKEIIGLLTPVAGQIAQRVFAPPAETAHDKLVDLIIKREFLGEGGRRNEAEPGPFDELQSELLRAAIDQVRGGGRGERPSVGIELVRVVGPAVPRMVERIATTVDNAINFGRERMQYYGPSPRRARATPTGREPAAAREAAAIPAPGTPAAELVLVLQEAATWALAGDETKFPQLAGALAARVPGCDQLLEDLRAGRASEQQALDSIAALGIEIVEPLAGYIRRFLAWMHRTPGPEPPIVEAPVSSTKVSAPAPDAAAAVSAESDETPCDVNVNGKACGGKIVAITPTLGRCDRCSAEYSYRS